MNTHDWYVPSGYAFPFCRVCGLVKRRDGKNKPCKGQTKLRPMEPTITIAAMAKRHYSREFTPRTDKRVMLTIDRIPPTLYEAIKAKAKREGVSLRALVLGWLKAWAEED